MLNEAVKRQMLCSDEYFKASRWEGKPLKFKFKYAFANYPEMLLCGVIMVGIIPFAVLKYSYSENSKGDLIKKFKRHFMVIRDDDPNVERFRVEKALGKEYFPE